MVFFVGFCFGWMMGSLRTIARTPIVPCDEHQANDLYSRPWD
jgi:hypothetical protein